MVFNSNRLNVLFIPSATRLSPATRYRVYQYLPYLKQAGIPYRVFPINEEKTTKDMVNSPNFGKFRKLGHYLQLSLEKLVRFWVVLYFASKYKVLFLQRTTFPFGLEKIMKRINKNIIFDIDDAIFLPDTKDEGLFYRLKRYFKTREIPAILKTAKWVVVENQYIKTYVQNYCRNISLIAGPIDTERIPVRSYKNFGESPVTIGWIGSPSTALYLKILDSVFAELSRKYRIKLKLVGAGKYQLEAVEVINKDWSEDTEIAHLSSFDIGVMPMPDDEWSRGKLGVKMLQYMSVGVPAVVSYTQTNEEVIKDGVNGFLVSNEEEWLEKLSILIENPGLRKDLGLKGRKAIEEKYSIKVNAPRLLEILQSVYDKNI